MRSLMLCILFQEKLSWHLWNNLVRSGLSLCEAFSLPPRAIINGAVEYIPTKTIKENVRTVVVPLNTIAQEIVDRYADLPGDQLLPFESSERYNDNIKIIFEKAGVTYLVTKLDTVTRTEV